MKIQIERDEHDEILNRLFELRQKCKKSKSKKIHAEYRKAEALCEAKFDYLVLSKLYKYKSFANYEDLKQDGRVALLLALRNFDPNKGNFYWWANQYIKTKIKREANRHSTIKIPIKQAQTIQPYKVSEIPVVIDSAPDPFQNMESSEIKTQVRNAIEKLPNDQKKIIELNGIKSYSLNRISKELNMKMPECLKLLNEAKQNLKESLKTVY
ncbi:MAG TPA: sigma-70 family RNA polymerase sigma factor [Flavobacteriaceae bacterium]|nr:sigma-70 family RNA polymerase sigma factor [Flavobacteriaceae bacterium]